MLILVIYKNMKHAAVLNFSSEISSFLSYEACACLLPKVLDKKLGPWNSSLEIVSVEDSVRAWLGRRSFIHLWDLLRAN